jgi:hypothetical protein
MIFMPFPRFVGPISQPATLGHNEGCVDEAFFFVQGASIAKLVGNIRQHATQNLIAAPSLKAPMHSFVVRVALRQHVPLRPCVENPQDRFEHTTRRSRFAPRTSIGNILLRKMIPDAFPLLVREPNHFDIYIGSTAVGNFEIGSRLCNTSKGGKNENVTSSPVLVRTHFCPVRMAGMVLWVGD